MHHVPPSLARQRFNARRRERQTPLHVWIADRIVLPCVLAFAAGVLTVLLFVENEPANLACEDAAKVFAHQFVAMGEQQ